MFCKMAARRKWREGAVSCINQLTCHAYLRAVMFCKMAARRKWREGAVSCIKSAGARELRSPPSSWNMAWILEELLRNKLSLTWGWAEVFRPPIGHWSDLSSLKWEDAFFWRIAFSHLCVGAGIWKKTYSGSRLPTPFLIAYSDNFWGKSTIILSELTQIFSLPVQKSNNF